MRVLKCAGSHQEMGIAIGSEFKEEIRSTLQQYEPLRDRFLPFTKTPRGAGLYDRLLRLHQREYPSYCEELRGIAEGSEQPLDELFLVNMRGEYRGLAVQGDADGCSTCSLYTGDSAVIGHNEDGLQLFRAKAYFIVARPVGKPAFGAFCYPGFLPGHAFGCNSEGICIAVNDVRPMQVVEGTGRHFIARTLLEARSLREAIDTAHSPHRASGFQYTIGSVKERRIVSVEVSADSSVEREVRGCYFHANHYIELRNVKQMITGSSRRRQKRGIELIQDEKVQDKHDVLRVLRDTAVDENPSPRHRTTSDTAVTLVSALFDLDSEKLTIYDGRIRNDPACGVPLAEFSIRF